MSHPFDTLTPDLVLDAVESTGFISDARVLALNSYENRVYQVGIEDETPIVAKFYRPGRWSNESILEEHQFSKELADREIPVVAPFERDGKTLFEHAGFRFALFPRRGGRAPEPGNLDQLSRLGQLLGRMHAVSASRPLAGMLRRLLAICDAGFLRVCASSRITTAPLTSSDMLSRTAGSTKYEYGHSTMSANSSADFEA